jgi:hypothetical protein
VWQGFNIVFTSYSDAKLLWQHGQRCGTDLLWDLSDNSTSIVIAVYREAVLQWPGQEIPQVSQLNPHFHFNRCHSLCQDNAMFPSLWCCLHVVLIFLTMGVVHSFLISLSIPFVEMQIILQVTHCQTNK